MKKTSKILKIIMILIIMSVCSIYILQNESIFGYQNYFITSNSTPKTKDNKLVLVQKINTDEIKKDDEIVYENNHKEIKRAKVNEIIIKENEKIILTPENEKIYIEKIYGKYKYEYVILGLISKIIVTKVGFAITILIPFITLIILELLNISKETKQKDQNEEQKILLNNNINEKELEKEINKQTKTKKNIEQTIQIPIIEIQNEIKKIEKNNLEDTLVLFNSNDLKEEIKKQLSTKTVDNQKNKDKKSVENKKTNEKSTESVEK